MGLRTACRGAGCTFFVTSRAADTPAPHAVWLDPIKVAVEIKGQRVIFPAAAGLCGCLAHLVTSNKGHW